jgi:hypothetical protein
MRYPRLKPTGRDLCYHVWHRVAGDPGDRPFGDSASRKRGSGPAGKMRQLVDAASRLPRNQQQKIAAVLEPFVLQHTHAREG